MPRVKGGTVARRRRKKILKLAKGYYGAKHLLFRTAKEQVMKSYMYAYRDRRQKKRDFRKLWVTRINAAARIHGMSYSTFMFGLKCAGIEVNRKMLSEVAIHDDKAFGELIKISQAGIAKGNKPYITGATSPSANAITITPGTGAKTAATPVKEVVAAVDTDYSKMTVPELKAVAKDKSIAIPTGSKKADILELLK
ncbi:hypothetical protein AwErysi_01450 [Erysipelotrichaceae bacterium]|nr:hypothetical protein AwErysi_01450 [Erysipelotrichaceae bacterium]